MPRYLLSYRAPSDYTPTTDTGTAWRVFFAAISAHLEDIGNPIFSRDSIGASAAATVLGGYSLITAEGPREARVLAARCPLVQYGGGVEIGELAPLGEMTAAQQAGRPPTNA